MNPERIKLLEKYIAEDPQDPFNNYALALEFLSSDPEKSWAIFEKLLTLHPNYLATYYHAAQLAFDLDKLDEAKEIYEKGIELSQSGGHSKAHQELNAAYQMFLFETED